MDDASPLAGPAVDQLQTALREMNLLVQQMRGQRDVARDQCQQLQRRWRQQVDQIEQRLNASQLECERLQRELESVTRPIISPDQPSRPRPASIKHLFARIRDQASCQ
jgi:hypothetical protein